MELGYHIYSQSNLILLCCFPVLKSSCKPQHNPPPQRAGLPDGAGEATSTFPTNKRIPAPLSAQGSGQDLHVTPEPMLGRMRRLGRWARAHRERSHGVVRAVDDEHLGNGAVRSVGRGVGCVKSGYGWRKKGFEGKVCWQGKKIVESEFGICKGFVEWVACYA